MPFSMQQTGPGSARRVLLIALLVVSIVLVTLYGREGDQGPLHSIQAGVMNVTGQAEGATAGIAAVGQATSVAAGDVTANASTLNALREQNEELRQMLSNAEEYRQEAERLQGLLDMKQVSGVTGPVARVIGRSTNAWDQSIVIDKGSADGVRSGMTVMGSTGVIGQVSRTADNSSTVRLLTDPNSGAAVMIQSTRELGIVRGSINGVLYLENLKEDVIPETGDVIVTSGLGGSYERGLIVGAVANVNKTVNNPTGTIIVSPNDSAAVLEEVIVVFTAPDMNAAENVNEKAAAEKAKQQQEGESGESSDEGER